MPTHTLSPNYSGQWLSARTHTNLPFFFSLHWHWGSWLCPENTLTLCSCPVSFGYWGPTRISILGVSFSKGRRGERLIWRSYLCCAVRSDQSVSQASIIVIYIPAFGGMCVLLSPGTTLKCDIFCVLCVTWPVHNILTFRYLPVHVQLSHTHTNSKNTDVCISAFVIYVRHKWDIKHTFGGKKVEMEASINSNVL